MSTYDAPAQSHAATSTAHLPPEVRCLFYFQLANSVNFALVLGSPMVLLARHLGATSSLLGCLMSFLPFLVLLQVFASTQAERIGYNALLLAGWRMRAFMVLLMVPLPLLVGHVPGGWILAAYTLLLLCFNAVRGYSVGGWMPWIKQVIPEGQVGRYFGKEQTVINVSSLLTLTGAGLFLGHSPAGWKYAVLLALSFTAGMISLTFLKRVPCPMPAGAEERATRSWRELLATYHKVWKVGAFRRVTRFGALNALAGAAVPGFLVVYQRDYLHVNEGFVLFLAAVTTVGAMLVAILAGKVSDKFGSRPLLRLTGLGQLAVYSIWFLSAAGVILMPLAAIVLTHVLMGMVASATAICQMRLVMAVSHKSDTMISTTLNSVLVAFCTGVAPLVWGRTLESLPRHLGPLQGSAHFALFFLVSILLALLAQVALTRSKERNAVPAGELFIHLVVDCPQRAFAYVRNLATSEKE